MPPRYFVTLRCGCKFEQSSFDGKRKNFLKAIIVCRSHLNFKGLALFDKVWADARINARKQPED